MLYGFGFRLCYLDLYLWVAMAGRRCLSSWSGVWRWLGGVVFRFGLVCGDGWAALCVVLVWCVAMAGRRCVRFGCSVAAVVRYSWFCSSLFAGFRLPLRSSLAVRSVAASLFACCPSLLLPLPA